ncbi:M-phase phosphoprotein 8 [Tritrichomonas musculus]|uniref:M-phase phosphoprotein 8 n=1 Tax=Tritrichomonas musculus TaxID=1915356 RepID=A0ABR2HFH2_9EUKA
MEIEEDIYEVEEVLDHRKYKGIDLYLIHWKGFDTEFDHTWEPLENLKNCLNLVREFYQKKKKKIPPQIFEFITSNESIEDNEEDNNNFDNITINDNNISNNSFEQSDEIQDIQKDTASDSEISNSDSDIDISESDAVSEHNNLNNDQRKKEENYQNKEESAIENNNETKQIIRILPNEIESSESGIEISNESSTEDNKKQELLIQNSNTNSPREKNDCSIDQSTAKKQNYRNLWDKYCHLFKVANIHKPAQRLCNREIEVEVLKIVGKRRFGNRTEYLVMWNDLIDKYGWVEESKLNCDELVENYERIAAKLNMPDIIEPPETFTNKIVFPEISHHTIRRAHKELCELKKKLFGA